MRPSRLTELPISRPAVSQHLKVLKATGQIESEPENTSEVEVRFVADGSDRTRVELEHRNIDRHGPGWQGVVDAVDGDAGWPLYLARYAALVDDRT